MSNLEALRKQLAAVSNELNALTDPPPPEGFAKVRIGGPLSSLESLIAIYGPQPGPDFENHQKIYELMCRKDELMQGIRQTEYEANPGRD